MGTMNRRVVVACCAFALVGSVGWPVEASPLEDKAVEVGPGIKPPSGGGVVVIETPKRVAESNSHANVMVRLLLDESGQVYRAEAVDAPDSRLAAAAVRHVRDIGFRPATRDDKPIVVWWSKSVSFRPRIELDAEIPPSGCLPATYTKPIRQEDLTDDVEFPRLVKRVDPEYPPALRRDHVEGKAEVECVLDTCGNLRNCRVAHATHAAFGRAGWDAVVGRRYVPARLDVVPFPIILTVKVDFRLQ
jgi:TonB family protein